MHASLPNTDVPHIGMALSGGGTRGVAHLGVYKALIEAGIQPTHFSGTSAGAIAGALIATGLDIDELFRTVVDGSSLFKVYKFGFPLNGLSSLEYLRTMLTRCGVPTEFDALEYHLDVGVSNMNTGLFETHDKGPLHEYIMASCAIPLMFKPVEINGEVYIDGGVFENMPAEPLRNHCDLVIGVNIMPNVPQQLRGNSNIFSILNRSFELIVFNTTSLGFASCDILIDPPELGQYHFLSFSQLEKMYEVGYEAGKRHLPEIKAHLAANPRLRAVE